MLENEETIIINENNKKFNCLCANNLSYSNVKSFRATSYYEIFEFCSKEIYPEYIMQKINDFSKNNNTTNKKLYETRKKIKYRYRDSIKNFSIGICIFCNINERLFYTNNVRIKVYKNE